jgi:16S rRNA (cytosine967-C5)-methyltransferase
MITEKVLTIATKGLEAWGRGVNLDEILDSLSAKKENEYRSKVSSILFIYFRNKAYIDYVIDSLVTRKMEQVIRRTISVALVQIFYQDGVAKEVAVDVAVSHIRKLRNKQTGGFVNAVLRNAIRGAFDGARQNAPEDVKCNVPNLLLDRWSNSFSTEEKNILTDTIKKQAPFTFRLLKSVDIDMQEPTCFSKLGWKHQNHFGHDIFQNKNRLAYILDECKCELIENLSWCSKFPFYRTNRPDLILKTDLIDSGAIYIQDPATAMAPCLVNSKNAKNILDICAAPGGKTLMFSELYPNAKIVAMDRSPRRLKRVAENIERTKKDNVTIIEGNALKPPFEKNSFDVVFTDVPCSNTGVIRRRPDVIWRFTQKHLDEILKLQMNILDSSSNLVKPGGVLVYSTCSIEKDENNIQIDKFLSRNKDFRFVKDRLLLPSEINDGAYAAVIKKRRENE